MEKQKKFLLVVPLLVLPFLTMAFWALGGGKVKTETQVTQVKGLDTSLPQAHFKDNKQTDKMDIYQQAKKDSAGMNQSGVSKAFAQQMGFANHKDSINRPTSATADESTAKIQVKLAEINRQISSKPQQTAPTGDDEQQVKRMNKMMKGLNSPNKPDPEMAQLNNMLTKIQAIQNPGSIKVAKKTTNEMPFKAIPAIVDGKQKVVDGAAVKLKLTDSVQLKDQWIPKGQKLYGVCSVTNQRLLLTIQNIRLNQQIIPVNLTVYSLDGMPGIPAAEAELGGAAANGSSDAIQSMQFLSMDQSLGAQAAAGGVNAAKGLFSKKVKKIKSN